MTSDEARRKEWTEGMEKAFKTVVFQDNLDWMLNMKISHGMNSAGKRTVSLSQRLGIDKILAKSEKSSRKGNLRLYLWIPKQNRAREETPTHLRTKMSTASNMPPSLGD